MFRIIRLKYFFAFSTISILTMCSNPAPEEMQRPQGFDTSTSLSPDVEKSPVVEVKISMPDTIFDFGDPLPISIRLTNAADTSVRLLFDRPITTGSPWNTFVFVKDMVSGKSVVKLGNLGMFSSQIYSSKDLEPYYFVLEPGQSYSKEYILSHIAIFDTHGYDLHRGTYDLQLFFYNNRSNTVRFTVK